MCYLGHIFGGNGIHPDPCKISSVQEWPTPTNATILKQFLGLASYYRRYIKKFADIATPLHNLSKKDVPFVWTPECNNTFSELKDKLTHAPILSFPQFSPDAPPFLLQTDTSTVGLGTMLEQGGHVIVHVSCALTQSEKQYSTIQKECLAAVYAMKQFCHYLLGHPFLLMTAESMPHYNGCQPKKWKACCVGVLDMEEYTILK